MSKKKQQHDDWDPSVGDVVQWKNDGLGSIYCITSYKNTVSGDDLAFGLFVLYIPKSVDSHIHPGESVYSYTKESFKEHFEYLCTLEELLGDDDEA